MELKLLDKKALASALGVTRQTLRTWIEKGLLPKPAVEHGRKKYWTVGQVEGIGKGDSPDSEDANKWRELQQSFSRPDQMRADVAPVWDSRNIAQ